MRAFNVTAIDLNSVVRAIPFVPFRVVTSDGSTYDVRHPELVLVAVSSVVIGVPTPTDTETASRYHIVSMFHIVRLEPMPVAATGSGSAGNGST